MARPEKRTQLWVYLITYISAFSEGYDMGVISGVLVLVTPHFDLTAVQVSLFMGAHAACIGLGGVVGGLVGDCIGRVRTLLLTHAVLVTSAIVMSLAESYLVLLLSRCAVGFGVGMGLCTESVYVNECSPARQRGQNGSLVELLLNVGIVAGYVSNYALHQSSGDDWRWMVAGGAVLPCFALLILLAGLCPESPRYLMLQGREEEARDVLRSLVGEKECAEAVECWTPRAQRRDLAEGFRGLFATPARVRMTIAAVGAGTLQMLTGISIVSVLLGHILAMLVGDQTAFAMTLIVGSLKCAVILVVNFYLIDRYGRRPLLLLSSTGMCAAAAWLGVAFQFRAEGQILVALCCFAGAFALGLGPVVYTYAPEVLETYVRAAGMSLMFACSRAVVCTILTVVPLVVHDSVDRVAPVWYVFAGINALGVAFVYFFCPETKCVGLERVKEAFGSPATRRAFVIDADR